MKDSLGYVVNSKPLWAIRDSDSKKEKKNEFHSWGFVNSKTLACLEFNSQRHKKETLGTGKMARRVKALAAGADNLFDPQNPGESGRENRLLNLFFDLYT